MANNIEFQNIKRQYPEFFKEFPPELMEFISSDETASKISGICTKNGIKDEETIEGVSYHIVSVLLSRLPIEKLSQALVKNLRIDHLAAKRIYEEVNRLIFSQIPTSTAPLPEEKPIEVKEEPVKEEPPRPRGKDIYHEPIA